MALRDDVTSVLKGDTALMAILTGSVHTNVPITRSNTPAAFDTNNELKPCALVQVRGDIAESPYIAGARTTVEIYFYQRLGYTQIDQALDRVYQLLNYQKVGPASSKVFLIEWADDVRDQKDQTLDADMCMSRYSVHRLRNAN